MMTWLHAFVNWFSIKGSFDFLRDFRKEFIWIGVFSLIANLLAVAPTLYMLQVFDRVMVSQNEFTLIAITLIFYFLFLINAFADWIRSQLLVRLGVRFDSALNQEVFRAGVQDGKESGGVNSSKSLADLASLRQFLTSAGVYTIFDLPWTFVYVAILYFMNQWLGIVAIIFCLLQGYTAWMNHYLTQKPSIKARDSSTYANGFFFSKSRQVEVAHTLGAKINLQKIWLNLNKTAVIDQGRLHIRQQKILAVIKFIQYTQQSLTLALGAFLAVHGEISAATMVAAMALTTYALRPIAGVTSVWYSFQQASDAYDRLIELIKRNPEKVKISLPNAFTADILVKNFFALAPGSQSLILMDINAHIRPGNITAIIGPSGSGKSTLGKCLIGLWTNHQGSIEICEIDIFSISRTELGPKIGYLPQKIELLPGTIAENICRMGEIEPEKLFQATQQAGIHLPILRLPKGYDTVIDPTRPPFSGGELQKMGIARAIYKHPSILILDEPNSNLDDVDQINLRNILVDFQERNLTVVIISYQLNFIRLAHQTLILKNGKIVSSQNRDAQI
jgi:ATP-binding cassette subfamily C exporter for protease/lipase